MKPAALWKWPAVVFLTALLLTALLAWFAWSSNRNRDIGRFENVVQQTESAIQVRLEVYIGLLRAGAGFFASSEEVTHEEFHEFVTRVNPSEYYPGVQGIGFARRVRPREKAEMVDRVRRSGRADFEITPPGEREEYFPIVHLEPMDRRNREAIGFDMFSEPTRHAAMAQARDEGRPVASGHVVLVQEIDKDKQAGFLIYVPVYRDAAIPETVVERRELLEGFIYSAFRADDLFAGILGRQTSPRVQFEVYDGTEAVASRLLHRSPHPVSGRPTLSRSTTMQIANRTWTVVYRTTPAFDTGSAYAWTSWVVIGGVLISGMLGAITLALSRAEERSRRRGRELFAEREQLRERERLLRAAASGARIGLLIVNCDYRYVFANEAYCEVAGLPPQNLVGRRVPDLLPGIWPQIQPRLDRALAGERVTFEVSLPPRENESHGRWLAVTHEPQETDDAPTVVVVLSDITERKRSELELRTSEARKDAILRSALDAVITIDHESRLVEFNPAAEGIFGYKREDVVGRPVAEFIIPARFRERHHRGMAHYLATGEGPFLRRQIELPAMRADGSEFPAELAILPIPGSQPPMFTAFLRDITERKRAERLLSEAAERFRFMAESMPQKIFTATPGGEVDYFNGQWNEFTGLTFDEIRDWGWLQFVHPDDREECERRWKHSVATGDYYEIEHRFRHHDAAHRWHLSRAHALRDADGKVRLWIGSSTDIEDQKRAAEQLEQTVADRTAALRETNEQLEAFVYTIAHDLRGPLRSVNGYAQLLADDYMAALDETGRHLLDRIQGSAEFMDRLILDLLAFGRTARAEIELAKVDVHKAWMVSLAQTASQAEQMQAQIETIEPLPTVRAHEATLGQLLANLLGNALKFVAPGVRPHIRFHSEDRGPLVRLWVEDNGIGIAPEMQERIFRVFERLHGSRYPGTGIGLSIVRKGAERMDGRVGVESDGKTGTKFWIELPRA